MTVLQRQVRDLRDVMMDAANGRADLPGFFVPIADDGSPIVTIRDTRTGRQTRVPLFAYGEVVQVLSDLFGGGGDDGTTDLAARLNILSAEIGQIAQAMSDSVEVPCERA